MAKLSVKRLITFFKAKPKKAQHLIQGEKAERYAEKYLKRRGFKLLKRNYRTAQGEIDLICKYRKGIVFVEVRSKKDTHFGTPEETIDLKKQRRCRLAAEHYLMVHQLLDVPCRFDVIALVGENRRWEVKHYKNAF